MSVTHTTYYKLLTDEKKQEGIILQCHQNHSVLTYMYMCNVCYHVNTRISLSIHINRSCYKDNMWVFINLYPISSAVLTAKVVFSIRAAVPRPITGTNEGWRKRKKKQQSTVNDWISSQLQISNPLLPIPPPPQLNSKQPLDLTAMKKVQHGQSYIKQSP